MPHFKEKGEVKGYKEWKVYFQGTHTVIVTHPPPLRLSVDHNTLDSTIDY